MRNKGLVKVLAILMALVCTYQLLFTWKTRVVEKEARLYSGGDYRMEARYLDSVSNVVVYNFLGMRKYTYKECKEREINLGLDLKGGMNVILEVSEADVVRALSNHNPDPVFHEALARASQMLITSQEDFITLFGRAYNDIAPNGRLVTIFINTLVDERGQRISSGASNEEVLALLRRESNSAVERANHVIRSRIDRFGVMQPNMRELGNGRILVELPGVKEPERVEKLLQGSANLEFWETFDNSEVIHLLQQANDIIRDIEAAARQSAVDGDGSEAANVQLTETSETTPDDAPSTEGLDLLERLTPDATAEADSAELNDPMRDFPLFSVLNPNSRQGGSVVGYTLAKDRETVNNYLAMPQVREIFDREFRNLRFLWHVKPMKDPNTGRETDIYELHALRTEHDGRPAMSGDVVTSANAEFGQFGGSRAEVVMVMNTEGARAWADLTDRNIGRSVAIVLDDQVYSSPTVQARITGGRSQITGDFTINEATDLANILRSGKIPARTTIIQSEVVGPTLGRESIRAGMMSFAIALVLVMAYLALYYNTGGIVANIALLVNMFFLMDVLASLQAVLTLPGIAGIVLTLGMANDANIIIFERIREELRAGKGIRLAVADGYKNAYSAIIDANITSFLAGLVLFFFGTGPIQGFATTLVLGILTSFFCSVLITRLIYEWMLDRNKEIKFSIPLTENVLRNAKYDFIKIRKKMYIASIAVIGSMFLYIILGSFSFNEGASFRLGRAFSMGIDFTGGRSYTVRFLDQAGSPVSVNTVQLQSSLRNVFDDNMPEVKTFGADNQVRIVTQYMMSEEHTDIVHDIDSIVEIRLFEGSQFLLPDGTTIEQFRENNVMNRQKVGASIASDIRRNAVFAVLASLFAMFLYIFLRFRNWQFGLAAVISQFHDALFIIGMYAVLWRFVPWSMEVDQYFIAAVLTVIGYSINDTVIIFDRIREWVTLYPKRPLDELYNSAVNSTLSRSLNTSLSTMFVLLIISVFGGEMLRGFAFAIFVGTGIGTYSSIFNGTPIVYDLIMRKRRKEKK